jgi:hypothetical protein
MKSWCRLPEDGTNAKICWSSVRERIYRLQKCTFVGFSKVYIYYPVCNSRKRTVTEHNNIWSPLEREQCKAHIAPLYEECHNSKNAHFELCPQEVCLRPYLPSGIASQVYFLKRPREGRSVILLMQLHHPRQWFTLSPEKIYFSSCDSVLPEVRYVSFDCTTNYITNEYIHVRILKARWCK